MKKAGKAIKYILSLVVAAVLVYFAFRGVKWSEFFSDLAETRWLYMVLFALASVLAIVFRTERWRQLLLPLDDGVERLATWDSINIGNLANVAVPGVGEFIRCGYVSGKKASYDKTLGTIVMERIWDVLAIIVIFALALGLKWSHFGSFFIDNVWKPATGRLNFSLWWIVAALVVLAVAAVWAVFRFRGSNALCGKIAGAVKGIFQGLGTFFGMKHKLRFSLYTVGVWTMYVLMSWFGLKAVPALDSLTFVDALFISAVGNIASVIPVPGGIGAYHYLIALTLSSLYGADWDLGILYATLCHESHAVIIIVLGVISYLRLSIHRGRKDIMEENETSGNGI